MKFVFQIPACGGAIVTIFSNREGSVRLSVGAVDVHTGNSVYFEITTWRSDPSTSWRAARCRWLPGDGDRWRSLVGRRLVRIHR